ncbi:MAG: 2-oxo-4-hydroxy-4-carboxy-5-ureidoimidazoline decarboxylase [Pseudomonadota bacterium]
MTDIALTLSPPPSSLDRDEFVSHYGGIYEHSAWIAEAAWDAGLKPEADTPAGLAAAMGAVVDAAGQTRQLELLRAHPDLAGKAAVAGELTAESTEEQASAGIDQCTAEEFARFQDFNERYKRRFAMPFIMAVRGANRHEILAAFESRLDNPRTVEFATALAEVHKIARLRLQAMAG